MLCTFYCPSEIYRVMTVCEVSTMLSYITCFVSIYLKLKFSQFDTKPSLLDNMVAISVSVFRVRILE